MKGSLGKSSSSCTSSVEQLCRSFSEVQQKGAWQDVVSFIIFYYLSFPQLWECLDRAELCHCCCPREHHREGEDNPIEGTMAEFLTGVFRGFYSYLNFLTVGYLNFLVQCC